MEFLNKDDKNYYENCYKVTVAATSFLVYANAPDQALELFVADAEINNPHLLYDFDSIRDYVYTTFEDEYREWLNNKSGEEYSYDDSWFEFAQEYLNYIYVDATEYGASQPYFIDGSALSVEETNDEPIVFEDKEPKKEFLDADVNISTGDISSNLDLGGLGALAGLMASEEPKESEEKLEETRIPAQKLIDKYKDTDKVTFKDIKADLDSYSPEASDETIEGLMAQVKAGLEALGFKANETELVKESKEKKTKYVCPQCGEETNELYDVDIQDLAPEELDRLQDDGDIIFKECPECSYTDDIKAFKTESKSKKEETEDEVDDYGPYYVKEFNEDGTDIDTVGFDSEQEATDYAEENIKKHPNHEYAVYETASDECIYLYDKTYFEESKSKKEEYYQMPEDEHIIWDSEIDYYDDDYMADVKANQYQDYLDNFEPSEPLSYEDWLDSEECYDNHYHWFEDSGIADGDWDSLVDLYEVEFKEDYDDYVANYKDEPLPFDKWYNNFIEDSSYDDWNILEDDLKENIFPTIDNQLVDNILLLSGNYGSNYPDFKSSGAGGVLWENGTDDFRAYMGNFDRVCITTQNGILGAICNDHDGTVSGQFYTLPDDITELIKALGYEDIIKERYDEEDLDKYNENDLMETEFNNDLYYGGIDARDLNQHIDLLKPIKDTISGYAPQDPNGTKTESKDIKTENNKIPRNWKKITYKSKIDTNVDKVGDTIEVERDEWNRPIATNLRTGKTALAFLDMLRNDEISEIVNIETADKEIESKKVECKELKTESVSYQDLVIAGESLWRDDAKIYETRVEGIYDCQTAGHGGYLVDTDVFPELAKYGDKTPIDNIVGFEEDYEALKVIWAVPEVLEKIQLDRDWYKNLTLDDVLRYDDKLNDDFRKEFPNKKEIAEVPEMKTENVNEDAKIEKAIKEYIDKNNGIFTDDSAYDIAETLTGIKDIDKLPDGLVDNIRNILHTKFKKEEDVDQINKDIEQMSKNLVSKWKNHKDFVCDWCGTTFTGNISDKGIMPNCPHCEKDRYKDCDNTQDGFANKDVHFYNPETKETIYTDYEGNVADNTELNNELPFSESKKVESKQLTLSDDEKSILKSYGENDESIEQVERALNVTEFRLFNVIPGNRAEMYYEDGDTKLEDGKPITADEAKEILGLETFMSGMDRSAFHWNCGRYNDDETLYVTFDSSKLFKESKEVKIERRTIEQEIDRYKQFVDIDDTTKKHLEKLEKDLLSVDGVTWVEYDLSLYADNVKSPIILVGYDQMNTSFKLLKSVVETIENNGLVVEMDELEDNDTYFYIVTYKNNWSKVTESKKLKKENPQQDNAVNSFFNQMDKYMDSKGTDMEALKGIETTANDVYKFRPEFADMRYGDMYRALSKEYVKENKLTEAQIQSLNKINKSLKTENKTLKTEGVWLTSDNKEEFQNGTIWAEIDIDPDYIEIDYENEDTDEQWLEKVMKTVQMKATGYNVKVMDLIQAPNGYSVVLKGTLQDIVDFVYDQKNYSIDKCITDMDIEVSKAPIQERLLGPSDETIADSKEKGLYTEDDNEGAKDEIKKVLGTEPGSDEEAQIDDIFDTDYDLVWDGLDDDEQEEYIKVAKSVRRLKPDEAFIDVEPEIDDKAKKNHLKADILTYAYLDIITKKTESKTDKPVKILRNPNDKNERVEIYKLPSGKYQTLYYSDEKSFAGAFSKFDDLDSAIKQAQKLRPNYILDESEQQSIPNIKLENKTFKR